MPPSNKPLAIWRRVGGAIHPVNDAALDQVRSLAEGKDYLAAWPFRGARSLKQLRLWWSLCGLMAEHSIFPTQTAASDAVKIACGHFATCVMPDTGEVHLVPKSIAFESLTQQDWHPIFEAALTVVVERWMLGSDMAELRREVWRRCDGPAAIGERVDKYGS